MISEGTEASLTEALAKVGELRGLLDHNSAAVQLRAENRIQDDPEILAKVGFKGEVPQIPADLIEECLSTGGTLVLKFKTTLTDYQSKHNSTLGPINRPLYVDSSAKKLAITNDAPTWINVPNTVGEDTLGYSKANVLKQIPGSELCDPMDIVLMLGYNNLATGEQMPGFKNKWTFIDQKNMLVGSDVDGIYVYVDGNYDVRGVNHVGLARRFAPESKN